MRAMGYYPTEQEVKNMVDEVKNSQLAKEGIPTTHVSLDEFIKLFVNHRPVYGIGKNNIQEAFNSLLEAAKSTNGSIMREELLNYLEKEGEDMRVQDLEQAMLHLMGEQDLRKALLESITADYFAESILGFEEVDETEL
jgi:Ca2+-binding EF-hand superfamily protein